MIDLNPGLIPVDISSDLYLVRHRVGDEPRFARNFRAAWRAIPSEDRQVLLSWWRSGAFSLHGAVPVRGPAPRGIPPGPTLEGNRFVMPRVELLYGWTSSKGDDILLPGDHDEPKEDAPLLSASYGRGAILRFRAPLVDRMPDAIVQNLVADRLANVLLEADVTKNCFGRLHSAAGRVETVEKTMKQWGYDGTDLESWGSSEGRVITSESDDRANDIEHTRRPGNRHYHP